MKTKRNIDMDFMLFFKIRRHLIFLAVLFFVLAVFLLLFYKSHFALAMYKVILCMIGFCIGALFDGALFAFAKPCGYLCCKWQESSAENIINRADFPVAEGQEWLFIAACLRKTVFAVFGMLGMCLAL